MKLLYIGAVLAGLAGAVGAQDIELYVTAGPEPRVMGLNEQNMREVVSDRLYMRHMVGPDMSVVLLDIRTGEHTPLNTPAQQMQMHYKGDEATRAATVSGGDMPPMHQHGQEVAIVLEGEGKVLIPGGKEFPIRAGELIIMPPGIPHTGLFTSRRNLVL